MCQKIITTLLIFFFTIMTSQTFANPVFIDNFQDSTQWTYIADDVMGGVSKGSITYATDAGQPVAILSGNVSTENNGGFIQVRRSMRGMDLKSAQAVRIVAKGNNEKYFIHLRTNRMFLPWQYYQAEFVVEETYKEFILPISAFEKSGFFIPSTIVPDTIISLGFVAFGRDHQAELHVKEIGFIE